MPSTLSVVGVRGAREEFIVAENDGRAGLLGLDFVLFDCGRCHCRNSLTALPLAHSGTLSTFCPPAAITEEGTPLQAYSHALLLRSPTDALLTPIVSSSLARA